jgi:hypothetical protein
MQRFNSFNLIHKALRAMLYDAALTLQQTYFADVDEAEMALDKLEAVIHNLEQHAHHEDSFILPAIETCAPDVVQSFENEHVQDVAIAHKLQTLVNIYRSLETSEERVNCGSCLNKAFRDFMVFNINHMGKEEIEINKVLWDNYTDEEIMEITERITNSIPPEEKLVATRWMMKSINKNEAIAWLKTVKKTSPTFVFQALFDMAETELPERIRTEVQEAVLERDLVF